jgi:hypothetical protein
MDTIILENYQDQAFSHNSVYRNSLSGETLIFDEKGELIKEFKFIDKDFLYENELIDSFEYEKLDDRFLAETIDNLFYQEQLV